MMAFIQLEDLLGTVEVIIFPNDYEKYQAELTEEAKLLHQRLCICFGGSAGETDSRRRSFLLIRCQRKYGCSIRTRTALSDSRKPCTKPWRGIRAMTGSSYSVKWKKAIKKLPVSWNIKAEEEIL